MSATGAKARLAVPGSARRRGSELGLSCPRGGVAAKSANAVRGGGAQAQCRSEKESRGRAQIDMGDGRVP